MHKLHPFEKRLMAFGLCITLWLGIWTVCYHFITFVNVTWQLVVDVRWPLMLTISAISLLLSWRWLHAFDILAPVYDGSPHQTSDQADHKLSAVWIICAFILVTIVLLGYHRSDFDDGEYLQLALQTMRHPLLVPHTFDASLGELREPLRFSPYRAASYETLVAFVSEVSRASVLNVYYLILPMFTGLASVAVAYAFLRWLHPYRLAAIGLLVFVLICLAWGETHVAYGNRMFVRLFQGKGLLVSLTTPMTLLAGLAVLRQPDWIRTSVFLLSTAAAVGVSSSGLIVSLITLAMIGLIALFRFASVQLYKAIFILALAGLYPATLSTWLKFSANQAGVTEAIGTVLPIHASFGSALRMWLLIFTIGLAGLLLFWHINQNNPKQSGLMANLKLFLTGQQSDSTWLLMVFASIVLPLNPMVAELFSQIGARNMSWRLAWAAPVPLLLTSAVIIIWVKFKLVSLWFAFIPEATGWLVSVSAVCLFLFAGGWTVRASNQGTWDWPGAKVPPEAAQAYQWGHQLKSLDYKPSDGRVLLDPRLAVWLPVSHPDIKLVMPGHGYPITFSTTMPAQEYAERLELMQAWREEFKGRNERFNSLLKKYDVIEIK